MGTSPATAIVAACSDSAISGPTKVAPTTTSRAVSTTSREVPGALRPMKLAPALAEVSTSTARAAIPRSVGLLERPADRGDLRLGEHDPRRALQVARSRSTSLPSDLVDADPRLVLAHVREQRARR